MKHNFYERLCFLNCIKKGIENYSMPKVKLLLMLMSECNRKGALLRCTDEALINIDTQAIKSTPVTFSVINYKNSNSSKTNYGQDEEE